MRNIRRYFLTLLLALSCITATMCITAGNARADIPGMPSLPGSPFALGYNVSLDPNDLTHMGILTLLDAAAAEKLALTYARCGIIVNVTPLEPEWEGHVTLEFSNTTTLPAKIYANEGIAQMIFLEASDVCAVSYRDRAGKYQGQTGVTLPLT